MERKTRKKAFKLFLVATLVALAVRLFLIENYRITSGSMLPNLLTGDLVLASKYDFALRIPFSIYELIRFRTPREGEIVALGLPSNAAATFVKRVVANEGDRVAIRKGELFVNEKAVSYLPIDSSAGIPRVYEQLPNGAVYDIQWDRANAPDFGPVDIPPGHFFVLGDNRNDSIDSRSWGPVPYSFLKGKVRFIWLSVDSPGKLRSGRSLRWVRS